MCLMLEEIINASVTPQLMQPFIAKNLMLLKIFQLNDNLQDWVRKHSEIQKHQNNTMKGKKLLSMIRIKQLKILNVSRISCQPS